MDNTPLLLTFYQDRTYVCYYTWLVVKILVMLHAVARLDISLVKEGTTKSIKKKRNLKFGYILLNGFEYPLYCSILHPVIRSLTYCLGYYLDFPLTQRRMALRR